MPELPLPPDAPSQGLPELPLPPAAPSQGLPELPLPPDAPSQGLPELPLPPDAPSQGLPATLFDLALAVGVSVCLYARHRCFRWPFRRGCMSSDASFTRCGILFSSTTIARGGLRNGSAGRNWPVAAEDRRRQNDAPVRDVRPVQLKQRLVLPSGSGCRVPESPMINGRGSCAFTTVRWIRQSDAR